MALREFTGRCAREDPAIAADARLPTDCGRQLDRLLLGTWSLTPTEWDPVRCPAPYMPSKPKRAASLPVSTAEQPTLLFRNLSVHASALWNPRSSVSSLSVKHAIVYIPHAETGPGPGHQLVKYPQPPAKVYAGASGHQRIITSRHKPR